MISTDLLIIESLIGWFVVGHNNMGPFSSRETALHLAQQLVSTLRVSGVSSQLYLLERHPPGGARMSPEAIKAADLAVLDSKISPTDGVTLRCMTLDDATTHDRAERADV
jgi:hypothetical protein